MVKEWQEKTIGECDRAVITPNVLKNTIEISEASRVNAGSEQGGYLRGFVHEGTFYATNIVVNTYGAWHKMRLKDDSGSTRSFYIEAEKNNVDFTILPFHSHPGENLTHRFCYPNHWMYKNDVHFQTVKKQVETGNFGKLSLVEIMNEDARSLSQEDIDNMPGSVQLLISPTYNPQKSFSHLQAYQIGEDSDFSFIREVKGKIHIELARQDDKVALKALKLEEDVQRKVTQRYQIWQKKVLDKVKDKDIPFQHFTKATYYLDINELEKVSLDEAVKIALEREKEEWKIDALALHAHLHEGK